MELKQILKTSESGRSTLKFLRQISKHLASREVCKDAEYIVSITDDGIEMSPNVFVFPDQFQRNIYNKQTVISHILTHHGFTNAKLVSGTYIYRKFGNYKRRRWTHAE